MHEKYAAKRAELKELGDTEGLHNYRATLARHA